MSLIFHYKHLWPSLKWRTIFSCAQLSLSIYFLIFAQSVFAQSIALTIYDDGFSCPANCDAHVVFHSSMNGTKFAYSPTSRPSRHDKCTVNAECRICFDRNATECMNVMYRGGGPSPNRFDFTPAFYEKYCNQPSIPAALASKCSSLNAQAKTLDGRVNCILNSDNPKCTDLIKSAKAQQVADRHLYEQCKQVGETQFNRSRPTEKQRSLSCAYEKNGTGGPNSRGQKWKRLLPGACRDNTFVGRDGLDCCNGNLFSDGPLGVECIIFYPNQ